MSGKCILCGEAESEPWGSENGYSAVRCCACGLVYIDPWPDMSGRDRALEYGEHPGERTLTTTTKYRPSSVKKYEEILEKIYGADYFVDRKLEWLDIGCGYGEFLEALSQIASDGSTLRGSEPNLVKKASAQERGLDVAFYDVEELREEYSHISLLNVFSHLPDPVGFLHTVKQKLCEGGEILLQTGNGGDISRDDFPGILSFPDHLLFGGRRSIELAFDMIGMEIVSVTEFRYPPVTVLNVTKDLIKRVIRRGHKSVPWGGPFRDLWVRARRTTQQR